MENAPTLIAYCGLYCGACGAYRKGRCPGCMKNEKATWCAVRTCCRTQMIASCALCASVANAADCKKLNSIISKVIGFFTRSSRVRSVQKLKALGSKDYASFMSERGLQSIKKTMP